jgi:REP element-mobilizing transposase RayT
MASPRLNKGRHSQIGHVYSITTVACGRRRLFADHEAAGIIASEIKGADRRGLTASLAWVLMPDHLHWLFQLQAGALSTLIQQFKARTAQSINQAQQRRGSVWQAGFHDHCVRNEESLETIARYLLENPIRAGLVSDLADYPYWWCAWQVEGDLQAAVDAERAPDRG